LPPVCRANVVDVTGVAASAVLGIGVVNHAIIGAWFAPSLVSPVTAAIGKHAREIAYGCYARPGKARTSIRVGPGVAAVRGSENEIRIVVREAAAAFVHASDVHVACGQVAGDLDVANEGRAGRDLPRIGPGKTVISGVPNK